MMTYRAKVGIGWPGDRGRCPLRTFSMLVTEISKRLDLVTWYLFVVAIIRERLIDEVELSATKEKFGCCG